MTVLQPSKGWRPVNFRELWSYRELLFILAWRDFKVRYRQTILGASWVIGQPLITMTIFTILFHKVAKLDAGAGVPYPVFVLSGIILWNFFAGSVIKAGNSLVGASYLISKVYFPRLLVPMAAVVVEMVDFLVAALLLTGLMFWYRVLPGPAILLVPVAILTAALLAFGIGLWLAALNVEYRDIQVVIPFVLQVGMYVTPVVYPLTALPLKYQKLARLNPMTGVVELLRALLLGTPYSAYGFAWSVFVGLTLFFGGLYYFRKKERDFIDIV